MAQLQLAREGAGLRVHAGHELRCRSLPGARGRRGRAGVSALHIPSICIKFEVEKTRRVHRLASFSPVELITCQNFCKIRNREKQTEPMLGPWNSSAVKTGLDFAGLCKFSKFTWYIPEFIEFDSGLQKGRNTSFCKHT